MEVKSSRTEFTSNPLSSNVNNQIKFRLSDLRYKVLDRKTYIEVIIIYIYIILHHLIRYESRLTIVAIS